MINQNFRNLVLRYCKNVNKGLKTLADELAYNVTFFSNKLNENNNKQLTVNEVKLIIKALVKWQAVTSTVEVEELLNEKDLTTAVFTKEELASLAMAGIEIKPIVVKTEPVKGYEQHPQNLPSQTNVLFGREKEIKQVRKVLSGTNFRLLTLTGPGGTGKTRLSLQAGRELLDDFENGVYFIELAAITNPELVPLAVARALGIKAAEESPAAEAVKTSIGAKGLLLILDNFEQVLGASNFVSDLLVVCPNLKILITSREVLHVYGERRIIVPPLALPSTDKLPALETLSQFASIALFVDRAQAVRPDFTLNSSNYEAISQICAYLDGLPLAIELVAARSNMFTPQALLSRLNRRLLKFSNVSALEYPKRHQSLENAIDWSYDLLNETEKELLLRLTVFPISGSLESIEVICSVEEDLPIDVIQVLNSLADKSLLNITFEKTGEPRFGMLVTVREYLLEKLESTNLIETLKNQHANYFLSLSEVAAGHYNQPDQADWYDRLTTELSNIEAAIKNALAAKNIGSALRFGAALGRFWQIRGYLTAGIFWLNTILEQTKDLPSELEVIHARAVNMLALIYLYQGEFELSKKFYNLCLAVFEKAKDALGISACYKGLGNIASYRNNFPLALDYYEKGLGLVRLVGNKKEISDYLANMGVISTILEDTERANKFNSESYAMRLELGDKLKIADSLNNIALVSLVEGNFEKALAIHHESLKLRQEMGHKQGIADSLGNMGEAHFYQGSYQLGAEYYLQSLQVYRELKNLIGHGIATLGLLSVYQETGNYEDCLRYAGEALAIKIEGGDVIGLTFALENYAYLLRSTGKYGKAARLLGFVEKYRIETNCRRRRIEVPKFNNEVEALHQHLLQEEFNQYWYNGYKLCLDELKLELPLTDLKQILTTYV